MTSQRSALTRWLTLVPVVLLLAGCDRPASSEAEDPAAGPVILYSSVDGYVLRELVDAFEAETGVEVRVVGDTEATKTTGLIERLITEAEAPAAHIWWSSEPFGTIRLAELGVLAPFDPEHAEAALAGPWPAALTGENNLWHGFGQRARVIAFHADLMTESEAPRTLAELTSAAWAGRVGIARPEFGTTRGHMAALLELWGPERFEAWLVALRDNGVRVYDGNATVVRAIRDGEIDVGLTDTDDVWHAQRNGWPIGMVYERDDPGADPPSPGPLLLPNTASLVAGDHRPAAAETLMRWILSEQSESILAASDSRNFPIFPAVLDAHPDLRLDAAWTPDLAAVADRVPEAMEIVARVLR